MMRKLFLAAGLLALSCGSANAGIVNVLWYTAGNYTAGQETSLANLAAQSLVAPVAPNNTLNITFWEPGTAVPVGSFNTLVVGSPQGGWLTGTSANYSTLEAAFGPGRDGDCSPPLPQIRTCPIKASGSSPQRFATQGDGAARGHARGTRRSSSLNRAHGHSPRRCRRDSHFRHTQRTS